MNNSKLDHWGTLDDTLMKHTMPELRSKSMSKLTVLKRLHHLYLHLFVIIQLNNNTRFWFGFNMFSTIS